MGRNAYLLFMFAILLGFANLFMSSFDQEGAKYYRVVGHNLICVALLVMIGHMAFEVMEKFMPSLLVVFK